MSPSAIVATISIQEFFKEAIDKALVHLAIQPNAATASYLVELLCNYAKITGEEFEQPLAPVLADARRSSLEQSLGQLQRVGDQSLYMAGFFKDSLRKAELDLTYYVILGGTAYRKLSQVLQHHSSKTQLVIAFSELGTHFARFVDVISYVKNKGDPPSQQEGISSSEIGALYEEWLQTKSESLEQRLREAGMLILNASRSKQ
jgi:hypothetical protein